MRKVDLCTLEHVGIDNFQELGTGRGYFLGIDHFQEPDTGRGYFLGTVQNLEVDMAVVQEGPSVALGFGGQAWPPTSHTRIQQELHSELDCFD